MRREKKNAGTAHVIQKCFGGDIAVKVSHQSVAVFREEKYLFALCMENLRMQELRGILRDSFIYYGLDVAKAADVSAWLMERRGVVYG